MSTVEARRHSRRKVARWRCWIVFAEGKSEITYWATFEDADLLVEETQRQYPRTRYEIEPVTLVEVRMAMGK
jgi:hypothetical protein